MKVSIEQLGFLAVGVAVGGLMVGFWPAGRASESPRSAPPVVADTPPMSALRPSSSHSYRSVIGDDLGGFERMDDVEVYRAIETLGSRALLDLAIDMGKQSFSNSGAFFRQQTIVARLAELDPEAALRFVSEPENVKLFPSVVDSLAKHHPERALALLGEIDDPEQRSQLTNAIASEGSPEVALQMIAALGEGERVHLGAAAAGSLGELFDESNIDDGLEFMSKISNGDGQSDFLKAMIGKVADGNPQLALQLLESHGPKARSRSEALQSLAAGWIEHDPAGARAWLSTLEVASDRLGVLRAFFREAKRGGTEHAWLGKEIAQFLADGDEFGSAQYLASAYSRILVAGDPQVALEWIRGLPDSKSWMIAGNRRNSDYLYDAWMRYDPEGALGYLDSLDSSESIFSTVAQEMLTRLAGTDPAGAASRALEIERRSGARPLRDVIHTWAQRDSDAAGAWVAGLRSGTDLSNYANVVGGLVNGVARNDPAQAAAVLRQTYAGLPADDLHAFRENMSVIGKSWAGTDPAAATAWAMELPPGTEDFRNQIVGDALTQWIDFDRQAASAWVATLEPGRQRDSAVWYLVEEIQTTDPEAAFHWAMSMSGEPSTSTTTKTAFAHLRSQDRDAARAVLEASALSAEQREALWEDRTGL